MDEIETAFQQTTALVLGTPLTNLPSYHAWLRQGQPAEVKEKPSALSGLPVYVASLDFFDKMGPRVITLEESLGHGQSMLELEQVRSLSLANATSTLSPISLTTPEIVYDKNIGTQESACYGPTQYCLGVSFTWFSKEIAYSFWARTSERLFGCANVVDCRMSIRCFSSAKLVRCFEMSDCNNCSDSLFCSNCEDVENGLFCFNVKAKRYAVCNVEVGKEEFMRIKKMVQQWALDSLSTERRLPLSIQGLGTSN